MQSDYIDNIVKQHFRLDYHHVQGDEVKSTTNSTFWQVSPVSLTKELGKMLSE